MEKELVIGTTDYLPGIINGQMVNVSLRPEGMLTDRIDRKLVRMLLGHDSNRPVGTIGSLRYEEGVGYIATASIPERDYTKDYREQLEDGVRNSISVGFVVREAERVAPGKFDATRWDVLEVSDETVPADVNAVYRQLGEYNVRSVISDRTTTPADVEGRIPTDVEHDEEEDMDTPTIEEQVRAEAQRQLRELMEKQEREAAEAKRKEDAAKREAEMEEKEKAMAEREAAIAKREEEAKEKEEEMEKRSAEFMSIAFHPNPPLTLRKDGDAGLSLANYMIATAFQPTDVSRKRANREIEFVSERGGVTPYDAQAIGTIPFTLVQHIASEQIAQRRAVQEMSTRTTAKADIEGRIPALVDHAASQGWLVDMAPVLAFCNVTAGLTAERKLYYGSNTAAEKPKPTWLAEGASQAASDPKVEAITQSPKVVQDFIEISSTSLALDDAGLEMFLMNAVRSFLNQSVTAAVLVGGGDDVPNGIWGTAGVTNYDYGAAASNFDRGDIIAMETNLITENAMGANLVYFLSPSLDRLGRTKERSVGGYGGFVIEATGTDRVRVVDYATPGVVTTQLAPATVNDPGILCYGSQIAVGMWSSGIDVVTLRPADKPVLQFALRVHMDVSVVNPKNVVRIKRG